MRLVGLDRRIFIHIHVDDNLFFRSHSLGSCNFLHKRSQKNSLRLEFHGLSPLHTHGEDILHQFAETFKLSVGDIEVCHFFLRVIVCVII